MSCCRASEVENRRESRGEISGVDEVVEKQMKRGKQCRKHNVQADKRTVKVQGKQ